MVEKKRARRALYALAAAGRISIEPTQRISGRRIRTAITSAVVGVR